MEAGSEEKREINKEETLAILKTVQEQTEKLAGEIFDSMGKSFNQLAHKNGFYDAETNPAEKLMLVVTEIAEVVEALRHGNPASEKIPGFSAEEEEIADTIIRLLDYGAERKLHMGQAIIAKHKYNLGRPYKHNKEF